MKRKLILASRSPARFKLLKGAGLSIRRAFPDIDESRRRGEPVGKYVTRLALKKAEKIAGKHPGDIIIAIDTVIALGQDIFGKPRSRGEARKFLLALSGRWHKVYSGTVVMDASSGRILKKLVTTRVRFKKLSQKMIDWYISTGEPTHAAGAYSIQNKGRKLIDSLDGCFTNVVGISIPTVMKMLKTLKAI